MAGKVEERRGLHIVEMIENASLMTAEYRPSLFVADVALVASEVDLGVAAKNRVYFGARH
jgi:hypothetical protein